MFFYLLAQMVGAGVLIQALAGIDFAWSVALTGTFMVVYVIFGGMLATTWVQIIKAGLLMSAGVVITVLVLARTGLNLFSDAKAQTEAGDAYLKPGLMHPDAINGISFGLAFLLGTAGLPHILVRFFTVPDARAARKSVGWAVLLIGLFYVMIMVIGVGRGRSSGAAPRRPARAATSRSRCWWRSLAAARARSAATSSSPSSARSRSRRSSRSWPGS